MSAARAPPENALTQVDTIFAKVVEKMKITRSVHGNHEGGSVRATFAVAALCGMGELAVMILSDQLILVTAAGLLVAMTIAAGLHILVVVPLALIATWLSRRVGFDFAPSAAALGLSVTIWLGISWHVGLLPGEPWHSVRGLVGTLVALVVGVFVAAVMSRVSQRAVTAALVFVVGLLTLADLTRSAADRVDEEPPSSPRSGWYFLIVCDTLRADHMSSYGYERDTTPFLQTLSQDAVVFDRAIAPSSWTRPSMTSLLTSAPVRSHQMEDGTGLLRSGVTTIAERFREAGFESAAFVTNPLMLSHYGFDQGFSSFDDTLARQAVAALGPNPVWLRWGPLGNLLQRPRSLLYAQRQRGDALNHRFIEWFDQSNLPGGFVWLHYMDVHAPYFSPAGSQAFGSSPLDLYDTSIRYWDGVIEDLATALKERGIWNEATIVFTSDHGEEFWEHGNWGHGRTLYNEVIHVPLIVKTPVARPRRVTANVSLVDVAPTLVDLAELEALPVGHQRSLRPFLDGESVEGGPVVSEIFRAHDRVRVAVVDHPWKLILRPDSGEVELFNLDSDPGEQHPAAIPDPEIVRYLLDSTRTWPVDTSKLRLSSPGGDAERSQIDPDDALRALGYLGSN